MSWFGQMPSFTATVRMAAPGSGDNQTVDVHPLVWPRCAMPFPALFQIQPMVDPATGVTVKINISFGSAAMMVLGWIGPFACVLASVNETAGAWQGFQLEKNKA